MDYISQATQFVKEAIHELKLVSWLSRQQMIASTIIVLLFTLVMAAYVSVVDRVLLFFAQILFRIG
jgi:preprotein translocase subunit SecE